MRTYLGDGAYAEIDGAGDLVLTAEDGTRATDRVVLGYAELERVHSVRVKL